MNHSELKISLEKLNMLVVLASVYSEVEDEKTSSEYPSGGVRIHTSTDWSREEELEAMAVENKVSTTRSRLEEFLSSLTSEEFKEVRALYWLGREGGQTLAKWREHSEKFPELDVRYLVGAHLHSTLPNALRTLKIDIDQ